MNSANKTSFSGKKVYFDDKPSNGILRKIIIRAVLLCTVSIAIFVSIHSSKLANISIDDIINLQQQLNSKGWATMPTFFLIATALVAIGFPRLILCACSGIMFGFWYGLIIIQLATLLGSFVPFIAARLFAKPLTQKFADKINTVMNIIQRGGTMTIIIARQLPITGGILNLLLRLMSIKKRHFIIGTLIGTLPEAVPTVMLGNSFTYSNFNKGVYSILISLALIILVWLFTAMLTKLFKQRTDTIKP